jgi:hypothetical protein
MPLRAARFLVSSRAKQGFKNRAGALKNAGREGTTKRLAMVGRYMYAVLFSLALTMASGFETASAIESGRGGRSYQIYLLKGLADIFSSGMDALAAKLQARGVVAEVHNHAFHDSLTQTAIAKWRGGARGPVIIIGHSLGADAAFLMAQRLNNARVPVALLVTFGPVDDGAVPANVSSAVNYFQSNSVWHGRAARAPGFRGSLANVDLAYAAGITHFTIDKAEWLHATTIGSVLYVIAARAQSAAAAPASPPADRPTPVATGETPNRP